jgi:hypothetical protein
LAGFTGDFFFFLPSLLAGSPAPTEKGTFAAENEKLDAAASGCGAALAACSFFLLSAMDSASAAAAATFGVVNL